MYQNMKTRQILPLRRLSACLAIWFISAVRKSRRIELAAKLIHRLGDTTRWRPMGDVPYSSVPKLSRTSEDLVTSSYKKRRRLHDREKHVEACLKCGLVLCRVGDREKTRRQRKNTPHFGFCQKRWWKSVETSEKQWVATNKVREVRASQTEGHLFKWIQSRREWQAVQLTYFTRHQLSGVAFCKSCQQASGEILRALFGINSFECCSI